MSRQVPGDELGDPGPEDAAALIRVAAAVAGPCAAVGVAGALVAARDLLGVANVAIVMVIVVLMAAAVGGRWAGLLTAGVGALAFNFFHTQPFLSFAVAAREDLISVVLLALVGGVVGEAGHRAAELSRQHRRAAAIQQSFDVLLGSVARRASIEDVWVDMWLVLRRAGYSRAVFLRADAVMSGESLPSEPTTFVVPVMSGGTMVGRVYATAGGSALDRSTGELLKRVVNVLGLAAASCDVLPERLE